jgi:hypothetical protein
LKKAENVPQPKVYLRQAFGKPSASLRQAFGLTAVMTADAAVPMLCAPFVIEGAESCMLFNVVSIIFF